MFLKLAKIFTWSVETFISMQDQGPLNKNMKYYKAGKNGQTSKWQDSVC